MKAIIAILVLIAVVSAKTRWFELEDYSFEKYTREFGKKYESLDEQSFRQAIFEEKLEQIKLHNRDTTKTWKEGVNHFTDRTSEEFSKVLGVRKELLYARKEMQPVAQVPSFINVEDLPVNVDWRQKGIIGPVKDQGECGSCWTFAAAETVEAYYTLASGLEATLSEQQILDCTPNPNQCGGTGGCQGGTVELAYARLIQMGGLSTEWTYPYTSYFGDNYHCNNSRVNPVAVLSNYSDLPSNQYEPILNHIATVGPLAITVDASTWSSYESGVFNGCNQSDPDLDHGVQLVGYGTDSTLGDYWLVRNSWSPSWGEQGYIRLYRTSTIQCGVDTQPLDGTGCKNGPPTVTVCGTCGIFYDTSFPVISN